MQSFSDHLPVTERKMSVGGLTPPDMGPAYLALCHMGRVQKWHQTVAANMAAGLKKVEGKATFCIGLGAPQRGVLEVGAAPWSSTCPPPPPYHCIGKISPEGAGVATAGVWPLLNGSSMESQEHRRGRRFQKRPNDLLELGFSDLAGQAWCLGMETCGMRGVRRILIWMACRGTSWGDQLQV